MRISHEDVMLTIAYAVAQRSTCARRAVGCVITDGLGRVLSTGFNGVPRNFQHCSDVACRGATESSGIGLDLCNAIHAETNAITSCRSIEDARVLYCTHSPCISCIKHLLCTPITEIIYDQDYPHGEAKEIWKQAGRTITKYGDPASAILTELRLETSHSHPKLEPC